MSSRYLQNKLQYSTSQMSAIECACCHRNTNETTCGLETASTSGKHVCSGIFVVHVIQSHLFTLLTQLQFPRRNYVCSVFTPNCFVGVSCFCVYSHILVTNTISISHDVLID